MHGMKMKVITTISLSMVAAAIGIIFYAYFNEWILFRNPWHAIPDGSYHDMLRRKKECVLFFWRNGCWHTERISIPLPTLIQEGSVLIVQAWCHAAYERGLISMPCTVQSGIFDARAGCLYLSFSQMPCDATHSTYAHLGMLESLLKTVAHNGAPEIRSVCFLVEHAYWQSRYIDGKTAFSIHGLDILR